MPLSKPFIKSN